MIYLMWTLVGIMSMLSAGWVMFTAADIPRATLFFCLALLARLELLNIRLFEPERKE